ncbi:hypothetical protein M0802_005898 [Mischocyttarus mexicanus]|nr:hypothetical protein M0802_005898 [Mischocyttarus mexicanus]
MKKNVFTAAMFLVFPYLTGQETFIVAKAYRFMALFAKNSILAKLGYYFTVDLIALNSFMKTGFEYHNFGSYLKLIPIIGFTFTNINTKSYFRHKSNLNMKHEIHSEPLMTLHLPIDDFVDITILSFMPHHITSRYRDREILKLKDQDINSSIWIRKLIVNYSNISLSRILIIFCRKSSFQKCQCLFVSLKEW